ncbi:MAG: RCC1 domain-containing protein, partial [Actinomycetota bacterium]
MRRTTLLVLSVLLLALPTSNASSGQAASPAPRFVSGLLDAGSDHTCALLDTWEVRCWGDGGDGRLGHANTDDVGDDEDPHDYGPVELGAGRTARAITAGSDHTCALLDNGRVRCWGFGGSGRLGYGNIASIGDNETPGSVGTVDLGAGRTARAITAGSDHTCALLDNGRVRCWGFGG